ncbi:sacsin N-terminal ATP-binding-like domain-containing protein [Sphingopyxis chilensis]|uniref:sacsin N-terminal ATP-binding-like domain-containing protein n=1 Tax=Sphingopyxis chilensis TaxID=180400 RepID=UPI002DDD945D|nr:hypothetical protein [Sphingopyxis chilensis]
MQIAAKAAAQFIWDANEDADAGSVAEVPIDPMDPAFAAAFIEALNGHLQSTGNLLKKAIRGAARSAEGTNVDPFHGIIEVVQNADDQRATAVRLALRDGPDGRQLLIVHDGTPVTYRNVAGMMLPYVTTKEDEADQRGRFGIGLKTLRRISRGLTVHSGPYHFGTGAEVEIRNAKAEAEIPDFFDIDNDTLIVLDLHDFDEEAFTRWFETWSGDSLIFLEFVRSVTWRRDEGESLIAGTEPSDWRLVESPAALGVTLECRDIKSGANLWTVLRAHVPVPTDRRRSYKSTGATTAISFASCGEDQLNGLFVGFRTRVPTHLPFAIDAQFDPTSSRENILEDGWNEWLIESCARVLAAAGAALLREDSPQAWKFIPLPGDHVGDEGSGWPREPFDACFVAARSLFAEHAVLPTDAGELGLDQLAYEGAELTHILDPVDTARLAERTSAIGHSARDRGERWRSVLDELDISMRVGPDHVLDAIEVGSFADKSPDWWIETAATLVDVMASHDIHGRLLWLCGDGTPAASSAKGTTNRKLFFGSVDHAFADKHGLYCRLHPAFGSERGEAAQAWLAAHADFSTRTTNEDVLGAFAEKHLEEPIAIDDPTLSEIKTLFDPISDTKASKIGQLLGRALLLEANNGTRRGPTRLVSPPDAYLPKAIDKDTPHWPNAAAGIEGLWWLSPTYEDRLRTGLGKAKRRQDGIRPRGAKRFLALLGVGTSPRLTSVSQVAPTALQRRELIDIDATDVETDVASDDLDALLDIITGESGSATVRDRRQRAIWLIRSMARDWDKFAGRAKVASRKVGRKWIYPRAPVTARWLSRLRELAWVPVGRSGFSVPGQAVLKNNSTEAIYGTADFVQGIEPGDIPEAMAEALGFVRSVRANDLVAMLENMRAGNIAFDRGKVKLAYRHLNQLAPRQTWELVGEMSVASLRKRFTDGGGLVVVEQGDGTPMWRRPNQVLRGKRILPMSARYVPDSDAYDRLWRILQVEETRIADCVGFLKSHAERCGTREQAGELIEVYNFLETLLADADGRQAETVRHVPLACGDVWRVRRPIHLVERDDLREGLRDALPSMFFWDSPCDPATIPRLVKALGVGRIDPMVKPAPGARAAELGEDHTERFRRAVTHLSDQLARTATSQRSTLQIGWDELREMKLFVYDDLVPVVVSDPALAGRIPLDLRVHVSRRPLELHISADALGVRAVGGRAIASFFAKSSSWAFDGEWALAWQEAGEREADGLRFAADEEERRRQTEAEAARIRVARKGNKVALPGGAASPTPSPPPAPLPPRKLKSALVGIGEVTVVPGMQPKPPGEQRKKPLSSPPSRSSPSSSAGMQQANVAYTDAELENFGWALVEHVLTDADGPELVDFRKRHHVGADGALDWKRFVELKASARSMPTSVKMTIVEYARAIEKGSDYILALTCGAEEGYETRVKLIFDPARTATVSRSEGVNVSGLADAAGIEIVIPDE